MPPTDWSDLGAELDCWQREGRIATFWWRDDDAVAPSSELDRLLRYTERIPLSLAVIPALATTELASRLANTSNVAVLQHGWRHENHGGTLAKSEYPPTRPTAVVSRELAAGRVRLAMLFGKRALPAFAPPFHGFDDRFVPLLAVQGIEGISRYGPSPTAVAGGETREVNVHVSLFDWQSRRFGGEVEALGKILGHLRGRRLGQFRSDEPTGILTHHLVQDTPSYDFVERFLDVTMTHPAIRWLDANALFA